MRLDKFLCGQQIGSRSEVKQSIAKGLVTVNGVTEKKPNAKVDETRDVICYQGKPLLYKPFVYYMLNKPESVVSATDDNTAPTVVSLLRPEDRRKDIFPAGRLDKDTKGFLLLTNDGNLSHLLLSPKKHVEKTYLVTTEKPLSAEALKRLRTGLDIGEEKPTLPAEAELMGENLLRLTIREGKYHQVKRMLQAVGNRVLALKRVSFGGLALDERLSPGEYRELTEDELGLLKNAMAQTTGPQIGDAKT